MLQVFIAFGFVAPFSLPAQSPVSDIKASVSGCVLLRVGDGKAQYLRITPPRACPHGLAREGGGCAVDRASVQPGKHQGSGGRASARNSASSLGRSLVAIPSRPRDLTVVPWCAFGVSGNVQGSVWFLGAEGLDEHPQSPNYAYAPYALYGYSIGVIRDLDEDGVVDLLVSAPGNGATPGKVFAVSTLSREVVHVLSSPAGVVRFGRALFSVPDMDGDGVEEIAALGETVPSSSENDPTCSVFIFSTASAELLATPITGVKVGVD